MERIPIALQLYSVREDCKKDFRGTLEAVARMGYDGVEFAGYYDTPAPELKKWLDDLGLRCAGTHTGIATVRGDNLQQTIEFNQTLDNPYLIIPGLPADYYESLDKWREFLKEISDIALRAGESGMKVGYHNHWAEFNVFEQKPLLQYYLEETAPEVLIQFDTGNAMEGGCTVLPLLKNYAARAATIHLKEYSSSLKNALVGEGNVDWQEVFAICEDSEATQWYIVEQESYAFPPLECVDKCLQNLKKMGK
jgi:sugar phosphate isomerase/epimerase